MSLTVPLKRSVLSLGGVGLPKHVKVTQWGTPLVAAKHVVFYFGGMPASAEEPTLHSAAAAAAPSSSDDDGDDDVYASRNIHLVCIDKPGMGGTSFVYNFRLRHDWPRLVDRVAKDLNIERQYGVIGVSNGGPYVMATLLHSELKHRVKAAAMVVGVSDDVWRSGYMTRKNPSTLFEGCCNSLPLILTGPINAMGLYLANIYLMRFGGFESFFQTTLTLPVEAKPHLTTLLKDGAANFGLGAALDCQQCLSLLYARSSPPADYKAVTAPVSLWYGTKDGSVPLSSAEWLHDQLPDSTLHKVEVGHELYFTHIEQVLDELVAKMDEVTNE